MTVIPMIVTIQWGGYLVQLPALPPEAVLSRIAGQQFENAAEAGPRIGPQAGRVLALGAEH